ncbi:MAG TPA: hypothetical protein DCS30_18830 [Rhizobiales bacterium]|nr:hypothetical protein [Hyphomicrobiales bacterium]
MDIRIEDLSSRNVIYSLEVGPYAEKAKQAWNNLWDWYFGLPNPPAMKSCVGYGLDSPRIIPADMLRYYACMELDMDAIEDLQNDLPASMGQLSIPGGRYAIHQMKGPYQDMPQYFMKMHEEWLPSSDKVPDYSRPFLEIYLNNPNEVGIENALTDLCMPIREDRI